MHCIGGQPLVSILVVAVLITLFLLKTFSLLVESCHRYGKVQMAVPLCNYVLPLYCSLWRLIQCCTKRGFTVCADNPWIVVQSVDPQFVQGNSQIISTEIATRNYLIFLVEECLTNHLKCYHERQINQLLIREQ